MDAFELVAARDNAGLAQLLAATPAAALARNAQGASLIAFAAYCGNREAIELIRPALPAIDPWEAIILGDVERVKTALAGGWDGNARASDGFTPLALAAFFRQPEIFDLLLPLTRDLDARADNPQLVAAIHAAAAMGDTAAVAHLLRAGANPDLPQQQGFVPLHTAGFNGDAPLAGLLLLFGADPGRCDAGGRTPADRAREKGHGWLADRLAGFASRPTENGPAGDRTGPVAP